MEKPRPPHQSFKDTRKKSFQNIITSSKNQKKTVWKLLNYFSNIDESLTKITFNESVRDPLDIAHI